MTYMKWFVYALLAASVATGSVWLIIRLRLLQKLLPLLLRALQSFRNLFARPNERDPGVIGPISTNFVVLVLSAMLATLLWIIVVTALEQTTTSIPFGRLWWAIPSTLLVLATFTVPRLLSEKLTVKPGHQAVISIIGTRVVWYIKTVVYKRLSGEAESTDVLTGWALGEGRHGRIPFMASEEQIPVGPLAKTVVATVPSKDGVNTTVKARVDYRFRNVIQVNQAGGPEKVVVNIDEFAQGGMQKSVSQLNAIGDVNVRRMKARDKIREGILDGEKAMEVVWGADIINVSVFDVDLPPNLTKALEDGKVIDLHAESVRNLRKEDVGLSPNEANQTSKIFREFTKETSELKKYDFGPGLSEVVTVLGKMIVEGLASRKLSGKEEGAPIGGPEIPSHESKLL